MALPAQNLLLVLLDGRLFVLDMRTLRVSGADPKLKLTVRDAKLVDVQSIGRDHSAVAGPATTASVSVNRRKKGIHNYDLIDGELCPSRDCRDGEFRDAVGFIRDRTNFCIAHRGSYKIADLSISKFDQIEELIEHTRPPLLKRVGQYEFIMTVDTDGSTTGQFMNFRGNPSRPPIEWPFLPAAAAVSFP